MINTVMDCDTIVITWNKSQQRWLLNTTCKVLQFIRQYEKLGKDSLHAIRCQHATKAIIIII